MGTGGIGLVVIDACAIAGEVVGGMIGGEVGKIIGTGADRSIEWLSK